MAVPTALGAGFCRQVLPAGGFATFASDFTLFILVHGSESTVTCIVRHTNLLRLLAPPRIRTKQFYIYEKAHRQTVYFSASAPSFKNL
jgi:hypothetical protein